MAGMVAGVMPEDPATRLLADVRALAGDGPRHAGRAGTLERTRAHVAAGFAAAGWTAREEAFAWRGGSFANVVAERAGGDGSWLVLLAHLDSVAHAPGAGDNAAGVAALIELARRFAATPLPGPGLRLVASDNEEAMAVDPHAGGSVAHAAGCSARGERLRAALALDGLVWFDRRWGTQQAPAWWLRPWFGWRGDYLALAGDPSATALARRLAAAMAGPLPIRPITTRWARPWAIAGDNEAFTLAGVPALRICDTDRWRYPYWHRADDGPGMVDGAVLATVVDAIARGISSLLKE
ncbi:MAG: M28 family peptidase [Planctomycetes bacterium]|nr:M28 family peptidase [Planctomycetota bacterium]